MLSYTAMYIFLPSFRSCFCFLGEQALGEDTHKYVDVMQRVVNREETVVELEIDDVMAVSEWRVGGALVVRFCDKD